MKGEKLSLLQRCIKWREANIKEKQFILILSFLVGIFTAFAALILKFFMIRYEKQTYPPVDDVGSKV